MYKVFFNDSTIQIASEGKISTKDNIIELIDFQGYDFVNQFISKIEAADHPSDFLILNPEVNLLWDQFRSQFVEIPAAGGLVRNENGCFLFIRRLGVWDLPKGKIEKQETAEKAAVREVEEECGLTDLRVIRQLDSTFHIYRSPFLPVAKNLVLKETQWFLMAHSGNEKLVPQVEEDIEEVRWFAGSQLDKVLADTYSSLREFLERSLPFI